MIKCPPIQLGSGHTMTVKKVQSLATPNGYYSAIVSAITRLHVEYSLNYQRSVELLYLAMMQNSAVFFNYIVSQWFKDGDSPLSTNSEGEVMGPSLVRQFCLQCSKLGLTPANGPFPRYTYCQGTFLGTYKEDEAGIFKTVELLKKILKHANQSWDHNATMNQVESLPRVGPVAGLSFYSVAVHAGFLWTDLARRESMKARIAPGSAFGKWLDSQGCDKKYFPKVITRLAFTKELEEYVVENLGCKACHAHKKWDIFPEGNWMYDRATVVESDGTWVKLLRKRVEESTWMDHNPRICPDDI